MAIDDPIAAVRSQYTSESANPTAELLIQAAGQLVPLVGLINAIRTHFSRKAAAERVEMLLSALQAEFRQYESKIQSPEFIAALLEAVEQSIRATNQKRIHHIAAVIRGSLCLADEVDWEEISALIADLAKLTDHDLKVLNVLVSVYPDGPPKSGAAVSGVYTKRLPRLIKAYNDAGFGWDEFYSHAARLAGFGLALEVIPNHEKTISEDSNYCFRPTGRGWHLIRLLSADKTKS